MELALHKAQHEAGFAGAHVPEQDLEQRLMILIRPMMESLPNMFVLPY